MHASLGGAGPPVCGPSLPTDARWQAGSLGAREAIKDPLKFALLLPERSSTAITASSTRKTQGDKRRCPGFKGVV